MKSCKRRLAVFFYLNRGAKQLFVPRLFSENCIHCWWYLLNCINANVFVTTYERATKHPFNTFILALILKEIVYVMRNRIPRAFYNDSWLFMSVRKLSSIMPNKNHVKLNLFLCVTLISAFY